MLMDMWQYEEGTMDGVALIIDLHQFTWTHVTKTEIMISQQFFYYAQVRMDLMSS